MVRDRNQVISAQDVQKYIAEGQLIVIHEGYALKLDGWLNKHPGGHLAILHMVGKDATDEINVYHFARTLKLMKAYRIGKIQAPWTNLEPPIRANHPSKSVAIAGNEKTPIIVHDGISGIENLADLDEKDSSLLSVDDSLLSVEKAPSLADSAICLDSDSEGSDAEGSKCSGASILGRDEKANLKPTSAHVDPAKLTRAQYTEYLEQKEIEDGICGFPSLDAQTQHAITLEYRAMHDQIKEMGYYECRYSEYGKEMIRYSALFITFLLFLRAEWYITSAVFLGMFWQQIMFTAHDAGHRGITGNFVADTMIGAFVADFCCGLSIGWWKSSHNVHHLITNMPEHDPDLQNVPLFVTSPTYFKSVYSTFYKFTFVWDKAADIVAQYQKFTYYPVMALARFNLYLLSWLHLMSPRAACLGSAWWTRWVEVAFMACYWALFGYALVWKTLPNWPIRVAFVLTSHMITMLLHVQITLSHWGMPTADLGPTESFPQRQLRTTMDINCPAWLDWLHGGLQFQAVHHLFPRVPRHNLRSVQVLVRQFCEKTRIEYQCYGFVEGNQVVLSKLEEVASMVETLVKCQTHMSETWESGLH